MTVKSLWNTYEQPNQGEIQIVSSFIKAMQAFQRINI